VKTTLLTIAALTAVVLLPGSASASTCGDYSNQAQAQRAHDTRDSDGDAIYCEHLPCPCLKPGTNSSPPAQPPITAPKSNCMRPSTVQRLRFSATKYPTIKLHMETAIAKGWPRILVLNRPGADKRRDRLLENIPTRPGFDRDEYPPAVGRGRANANLKGLVRGINPLGWLADVMYVPSSENRSHGSTLGAKLRGLCNGVRFRYVFVR
jgi:hypothetical protein